MADYQRQKAANDDDLSRLGSRLEAIDARVGEIDGLLRRSAPFLAARQCVDADAPVHLACLQAMWEQIDGLIRLQLDNIAYRYSYPDTTPAPAPFRRHTRSLLVGGTGWVYGYYVPTDHPELAAPQEQNLRRQLSLAGVDPDKFVDRADYDMIVAVAASQDQFVDLVNRVVFGLDAAQGPGDEFTVGEFSRANQAVYASLKGTETERLDCHSNGAMVCLAAIWNGDVAAGTVRLFGPQLTPAALARWEQLLRSGKIKSLEVDLTRGDPIGPASYEFGKSPRLYAVVELAKYVRDHGAITNLAAFAPEAADKLSGAIEEYTPAIQVRVFDDPACVQAREKDSFACHDMAGYQRLAAAAR